MSCWPLQPPARPRWTRTTRSSRRGGMASAPGKVTSCTFTRGPGSSSSTSTLPPSSSRTSAETRARRWPRRSSSALRDWATTPGWLGFRSPSAGSGRSRRASSSRASPPTTSSRHGGPGSTVKRTSVAGPALPRSTPSTSPSQYPSRRSARSSRSRAFSSRRAVMRSPTSSPVAAASLPPGSSIPSTRTPPTRSGTPRSTPIQRATVSSSRWNSRLGSIPAEEKPSSASRPRREASWRSRTTWSKSSPGRSWSQRRIRPRHRRPTPSTRISSILGFTERCTVTVTPSPEAAVVTHTSSTRPSAHSTRIPRRSPAGSRGRPSARPSSRSTLAASTGPSARTSTPRTTGPAGAESAGAAEAASAAARRTPRISTASSASRPASSCRRCPASPPGTARETGTSG